MLGYVICDYFFIFIYFFITLQLANHFCNSIGVLQQDAVPTSQESENKDTTSATSNQDGTTVLFASLITRTAQDIDILIDSLPSHEYTEEMQVE